MRDAQRVAQSRHRLRLGGRAPPQVVIDGNGQQPRRRREAVEMALEEKEKGGGVAAAGHGRDHAAGKIDLRKEVVRKVWAYLQRQHAASALSCFTRSLRVAEMSG